MVSFLIWSLIVCCAALLCNVWIDLADCLIFDFTNCFLYFIFAPPYFVILFVVNYSGRSLFVCIGFVFSRRLSQLSDYARTCGSLYIPSKFSNMYLKLLSSGTAYV